MSPDRRQFRMDFILRITAFDEDKGIFEAEHIPDPQRYEWKERNGKQYLYDKLDKIWFSKKFLSSIAKQMPGRAINFQPPKIDNAEQYVKGRIPLILERLKGNEELATFEDKSEAFLESLAVDKLAFVILCVDIVGSTKLSTTMEPHKYVRLISTTLYEISEIIPKFHGHVLKYTGDGLIAYFPEPSFVIKNDLAIDCALTIGRLVYDALNQVLEENDYPHIDIRIGLDSGEAYIETIGSPKTKQHRDIIGDVVSLAAKIQSLGNPGDILLGDATIKNLHTKWRKICEHIKLHDDWKYKGRDGKSYEVYRVKK